MKRVITLSWIYNYVEILTNASCGAIMLKKQSFKPNRSFYPYTYVDTIRTARDGRIYACIIHPTSAINSVPLRACTRIRRITCSALSTIRIYTDDESRARLRPTTTTRRHARYIRLLYARPRTYTIHVQVCMCVCVCMRDARVRGRRISPSLSLSAESSLDGQGRSH